MSLWPLCHTGCIIKRVPAGVWSPGERGENKACWQEREIERTPLFLPSLSSPLPLLLKCQIMARERWDLTQRGERDRRPSKEQHGGLEKLPPSGRVRWSETYHCWDVWRIFAPQSHADTITRKKRLLAILIKWPARSNIASQWGIDWKLTALKETHSLIQLFP